MTSSQTREYGRPAQQFGSLSRTAAPSYQTSRSAAPTYRDQTSQYRPPQAHFGAPVTSPPQLLSQEFPQRPWDEEGYNFEEDGGHRVPETSRDFFDSFPVTVHDQSDPELERAVNDFAHSFESIKQRDTYIGQDYEDYRPPGYAPDYTSKPYTYDRYSVDYQGRPDSLDYPPPPPHLTRHP